MEQKSVRRIDFDNLETGRSGPRRSIPKSVFNPFDVSAGHFFRYVPAPRVGNIGRAKRRPRCLIAFRNVGIVDGRFAVLAILPISRRFGTGRVHPFGEVVRLQLEDVRIADIGIRFLDSFFALRQPRHIPD